MSGAPFQPIRAAPAPNLARRPVSGTPTISDEALTGLANRALFQNRVEHALERQRRGGVQSSVLFMDLDDFKTVNDSLGHVPGDRLLTDVAARIQQCRLAAVSDDRRGDEFGILIEDQANAPIHPEQGLIAPLDFIPLAEETGQIVPIGGWVLDEACRTAVRLQASHPGLPMYMAVNLSARQLQRPEIVDEVAAALTTSGLAPADLVLEITESVLMDDIDLTIERLQRLKELGVQLAIDDFGTGYSSLNYLRRFPVDIVKMDRSFVDGIAVDGHQRALVAMIVDLARALGLRQVAEGIERPEQLAELKSLGCGFGQGFLFARPLAFADLDLLLDGRPGLDTAA